MRNAKLDTEQALRNIQGFAAQSYQRMVAHRERFLANGTYHNKVMANAAANNAAAFAAIVRREMGNV
jgi:hypothetical protein